MLSPKIITQSEIDTLCQDGQAIDEKGGYPAVVLHPNDTITKIWARKKGLFSSSTLTPYSNRFIKNATKLAERGVIVPEILSHSRLENSHVRLVTYRSLPGISIRELLRSSPESVDIPSLVTYILQLHETGISFGGMHLGNIIQRPNHNGYGLIDFTDVRFFNSPLDAKRRGANLSVPLRYAEDINHITQAGHPNLLTTYLDQLAPSPSDQKIILANATGSST